MNARRLYTLIGTLLFLALATYGWNAFFAAGSQEEAAPETASISLERSATGSNKTADELISFWQGRVQNAPSDYISMTYLGQAYLNKARETADVSNYNKAEEALQAALTVNPDYLAATAYLGSVRFAQHEFAEALSLAQMVYADDPEALLALALIGDAQLELGQYDAAETTYNQLYDLNESPPVLSRLARLAWLNGDAETAVSLLTQAETDATDEGQSGESLAWYQFQVGELYFHQGELESAKAQYEAALDTYPNYYLGLAGLAKIAAAQGDLNTAIALYETVTTRVPQPTYIAALGDLYAAQNDWEAAEEQYELIELIVELEEAQGILFNQQIGKFYADHDLNLAQALAIAEAELTSRQDVYSYDLYAWALFKNGRFSEATDAITEALKLNTPDANFYYHAGMIYDAQGELALAETMFNKALAINPYFDLDNATVAQEKLESYGVVNSN